jgi:hypothetical protein
MFEVPNIFNFKIQNLLFEEFYLDTGGDRTRGRQRALQGAPKIIVEESWLQ